MFLLIARVGPSSLHREWLKAPEPRNFDTLLSAYDKGVTDPAMAGVSFEYRPGSKVAGYAELFADHADFISRYDYVALFDDDLAIGGDDISRLFAIVARYRLAIAQPALSSDSYFTYAALVRAPAFMLRFVNYIEMMCPVFSRAAFEAARPLFALGYESGIDLVWCNIAGVERRFAVVDAVPVRHSRPVGTLKEANGFTGARRYEDDIAAVLQRFGLPWLSCVPYEAVDTRGKAVKGRWRFVIASLRLAAAVPRRPGFTGRARSVAVHWKHLLTRRALNLSLRVSAL